MRLQASLAFALIVLTAAAVQAAPLPDITPWVHWIPYPYDTRPKNVALLNDMPCSLLSHPNEWDSLYLAYGVASRHSFFVDVPDCSAPAGSGWTIPIFFRSRERLPKLQVAIGGLISMPFMAAARPIVTASVHAPAGGTLIGRGDTDRSLGPLARWRDRSGSRLSSGSRFDASSAMPRTGGARTLRPSGMPEPDRQNPFSGPAPGPPAVQPATMPRACCVSAAPRLQPVRSRRIRR